MRFASKVLIGLVLDAASTLRLNMKYFFFCVRNNVCHILLDSESTVQVVLKSIK